MRKTFNTYYLAKLEDQETVEKGGILIASTKGERTDSRAFPGKIVSVPDKQELKIKVGDVVYISRWEYHELMIGAEKFIAFKEGNIILKV